MPGKASVLWQESMARQLRGLGRWFEGRLVIERDETAESIPAERYLDAGHLNEAINRALHIDQGAPASPRPRTGDDGDAERPDARIAASRFTRHYSSALSAVALTGLAQGVGIDVSSPRCAMVIHQKAPMFVAVDVPDRDVLRCAERPTTWPVGGAVVGSLNELREYVWRKLYSEHLEPVFARILEIVDVSPKLLWANAAEWVGMLSDAAEEYLGEPDAAPFVADREALLQAATLPGQTGPNPLRGQLDWVPVDGDEYPSAVQTRRVCCLTYLLPDRRGRLCQNCSFLPLADRVALIRERHDVPRGNAPTGPAVQKSIDIGLAKLQHVNRSTDKSS